ncbi:methyltransferase domain-containing protein [Sporolactobacillus shoreae]|uniref:Methyltransferase domain-containing protein n=1 Tax=Sporolactobacillus shoreae TaxID=1465501 RepID=A0A4Z0GRD8_9BACL|nr:class I SAM-dependent methyltransferase [Sporolactobacillus shoreae]TGA99910.1 methyltransferase domain-containing protein [Sporolactobacillus shoreae]
MDQQGYWDKVAAQKQFTTPFQFNLFRKYVSEEAAILDYGCGYGRTLLELKERRFAHLYGVDFSAEMISRARRNSTGGVDLRAVKSGKLPFPDHTFDAVLLFAVLTCVYKDKEQDTILSELRRVLKPKGIIYINDFLLNEDERNIARYKKYQQKYQTYGVFELPDGAILRHHSQDRVREWTKEFRDLEMENVVYTTMNGHLSNGLVYIGRRN